MEDKRREPPELAELRNIGVVSPGWLNGAGIYRRDQLEALGPVGAYHLLKALGYPANMNLVYAIQAALMDLHWAALPPEVKAELRRQCGLKA